MSIRLTLDKRDSMLKHVLHCSLLGQIQSLNKVTVHIALLKCSGDLDKITFKLILSEIDVVRGTERGVWPFEGGDVIARVSRGRQPCVPEGLHGRHGMGQQPGIIPIYIYIYIYYIETYTM